MTRYVMYFFFPLFYFFGFKPESIWNRNGKFDFTVYEWIREFVIQ